MTMYNTAQWYYIARHNPTGNTATKEAEAGLSKGDCDLLLPDYKHGERLTRDQLEKMVAKWNVIGAPMWSYSIATNKGE